MASAHLRRPLLHGKGRQADGVAVAPVPVPVLVLTVVLDLVLGRHGSSRRDENVPLVAVQYPFRRTRAPGSQARGGPVGSVKERGRLFVGGDVAPAERRRRHRGDLAPHRGAHRPGRRRRRRRRRLGRRRRPRRVRRGSVAPARPAERIDAVRRLAELYGTRRREMAQLITEEMGSPISFSKFAAGDAAADPAQRLRRHRRAHHVGRGAAGYFGGDVLLRHEAVGVARGHRPLEHAAVPDRREAGARPDRRLPDHRQARARDAARRPAARRAGRGARPAARPGQRAAAAARGGPAPGRPPRRRQGVVHRLHRGRPPGRRLCGEASSGSASSWAASRPRSCSTTPSPADVAEGVKVAG
jgi:hypothetical protein